MFRFIKHRPNKGSRFLSPHSINRREAGSVMVEATFAMPLLLLVLLASFDLMRVCYYQLSLEYSLTKAARQAKVTADLDQTQARELLSSQLGVFGISLSETDKLTVCPVATFGDGSCLSGSYTHGDARDLMAYQAEMPVTIYTSSLIPLLGLNSFNLRATVLARNEPA